MYNQVTTLCIGAYNICIYLKVVIVMLREANAMAKVQGSESYPEINGSVLFYQTDYGVIVAAQIYGLPVSKEKCHNPVFGFHIHEGEKCEGNSSDHFADAMLHYNPEKCLHPYHAGDMPPLFGNEGYAFQMFLTDRFKVDDVIGRTVIIHDKPDDFTTQPSGNSGEKIACGIINRIK